MGLFSRAPLLSVAILDDFASGARNRSEHEVASDDVEVVQGSPRGVARRVTGRWVMVVAVGTPLPPALIARVRRELPRARGALVLTEHLEEDDAPTDDELLERALTSPLVAVRRSLIRYDDFASPVGADILVRVGAISRLRVAPTVVPVVEYGDTPVTRSATLQPTLAVHAWMDVFERIDAMARKSKRLRRPLLAVKRQIARELGRVIAREPALRLPTFEEAKSRGFTGFSERTVNVECSRDLVIVYGFPPFLDTGGLVVSRRFRHNPEPYDVLTQDMSQRRPKDERSLQLASTNLGRRMVVRGPLATGNWAQVEHFCLTGMAKIAAREAESGLYRTVYTRSMWIAPSVLGAWYKARNPGTPWTAELSDPLAYRPNGEVRPNPFPDNEILREIRAAVEARNLPGWAGNRFFEAVEWMVYALADRIIFTNENQRDFMLGVFPDRELAARARAVSVVQPHPVPEPDLYGIADSDVELPADRINIGYFGNFYKVRKVEDLLAPFALLTPHERQSFQLTIFTATVEETASVVADSAVADCVRVLPAQPYFDFLSLTRRMDWLVVVDANSPAVFGRNPFLPSKLADYRGSGTPIWGIVEDGSVLSSATLEARSSVGDPADSARVLRLIRSRHRGGTRTEE